MGEQAAALANPHDRVVALRRVTAAAQVLLARTMVMRALSLLSVRWVLTFSQMRLNWILVFMRRESGVV